MEREELSLRARFELALQREVSRALSPLWVSGAVGVLSLALGYRVEEREMLRREYRRIRGETKGPLLICANHLTMIDSAVIALALGSPLWYVLNYSSIPWNVPERRNFAYSPLSEILGYLMKCLPITRGGERAEVGEVLNRFIYLLSQGEVGLLFPEGGRSRSGRVEIDSAATGVGRVVTALPGCRVLCVYLRGAHQDKFSLIPARGDTFRVQMEMIEPSPRSPGLRGSHDVAQQIVAKLAAMEQEFFDARKRRRGPRGPRSGTKRHASAV